MTGHPRIRRKIQLTQSLLDAMNKQGDSYVLAGNLSFSDCVLISMGGYVPSPMTTPVLIRLATQYKAELQSLRNARQVRMAPTYLADSSLACVDAFVQRVERDFDIDKNGAISLVILYASHIYKTMLESGKERSPFQLTITGFDQARDVWGMNVLLGNAEQSVPTVQVMNQPSSPSITTDMKFVNASAPQPVTDLGQSLVLLGHEDAGSIAAEPVAPINDSMPPSQLAPDRSQPQQDPSELSFDTDDLLDAFSI